MGFHRPAAGRKIGGNTLKRFGLILNKLFSITCAIVAVIIFVAVANCLLILRVWSGGGKTDMEKPRYASLLILPTLPEDKAPRLIDRFGDSIGMREIAPTDRYFEYAGVIHVHTRYSDGGGTYNEVASIADSLGLDFIIPSDHNTLAPLTDGWARRVGNILVIPAVEHSTDHEAGHFLAIGDNLSLVRSRSVSSDSVYHETLRKGNMIFLAHVFHPHIPWENWNIDGYTGIEIFNLDENWRHNIHLFIINRLVASTVVYPFRDDALNYIIMFPGKQLELFDVLNENRKVVAIGSTDAHSKRIFPGDFKSGIPSYASIFKIVQTVIITRTPFDGRYKHDRDIVLKALRFGSSYIGFPCYGDVRGFYFTASSDSTEITCGDSLYTKKDVQLHIELPDSLNVTVQVVLNGKMIKEAVNTRTVNITVDKQGAYRVQVFRDRVMLPFFQERHFPWILSNPIYISKGDMMSPIASLK